MSAKKIKKEEAKMDLTELKPNPNEEFEVQIDATMMEETLNEDVSDTVGEEPTEEKSAAKTFKICDTYAHVYSRVTNGNRVIAVLREGAKVAEVSRTFNWVQIELEDGVRGFVRPQQLEEFKEEVDD